MAKYDIVITEEVNSMLSDIANAAETSVEDLIQDFLSNHLGNAKIDLVIGLYKKGKLKAREAWKLTGLSYQEFQSRAMA